ncbi:hypothetical protein HUJ04_004527 [Dendroctonus ponderosae]|nr:hypothetical protein HUJ04_004527 [Dendroctonus ponderosae]
MSIHIKSNRHVKRKLKNPHSEYVPVFEEAITTAGSKNANQSAELALRLSKLMGPIMCLICQDGSRNHRYSKKHIPNVLAWIQSNDTNHDFYPDNVALLFCAECNVVHLNNEIALDHYRSAMHDQNAEKYCIQCQRSFNDVQLFKEHLQTRGHQRQNGAINGTDAEPDRESQSENENDKSAECSRIQTEEATGDIEHNLQKKVLGELEGIADKLLAYKTVSSLALLRKLNAELAALSKCKSPTVPSEIGHTPDNRLCCSLV